MRIKDTSGSWEYLKRVLLPILLYSGIAGSCVGIVVTFFNYGASKLAEYSTVIYDFFRQNLAYIPILFLGLIALACVMGWLTKTIPEVRGSGIPRTEGILRGLMTFKPLRLIAGTLVGSFISFFSGLPLGSEGPSVQLGAATADSVSETIREKYAWRRYVTTGGASAGFAVAFHAPVTGIIFVLEDIHKQFNPLLLLSAMTAVSFAIGISDALSLIWGGATDYLGFASNLVAVPMNLTWALLIVGIITGFVAVVFNYLLLKVGKIKFLQKIPRLIKIIAVFILTGIAGLLLADSIGSGYGLLKKLLTMDFAWQIILVLFVVKLVLIVCAFDSGSTGGLFVPMLIVGALLGALNGKLLIAMGIDSVYYNTIILITMASFLGAVIRAPITALVLLVETTGAAIGFLTSGIEIFVAFIFAEVLLRRPLYDVLLERELKAKYKGKMLTNKSIDIEVEKGAFVEGKSIREIMWPARCSVHSIVRNGNEILVDSRTRIEEGDKLHLQASLYEETELMEELKDLVKVSK